MKKILFTILAAAAVSAACTKFAEDVIPTYDTVGKPLVEATVADDDSLDVTITAGENTSYYGYVVVQGTLDGVTAEKLVANGYIIRKHSCTAYVNVIKQRGGCNAIFTQKDSNFANHESNEKNMIF